MINYFSILFLCIFLLSCSKKEEGVKDIPLVVALPFALPVSAVLLTAEGLNEVDKNINAEKYKKLNEKYKREGMERGLKIKKWYANQPKKIPADFYYKGKPISPENFNNFMDGRHDHVPILSGPANEFHEDGNSFSSSGPELSVYGDNVSYKYLGKIKDRHLLFVSKTIRQEKKVFEKEQLRFFQIKKGQIISNPNWLIYELSNDYRFMDYSIPLIKAGKVYYLQFFDLLNGQVSEKYGIFQDKSFFTRPRSATILWEFDPELNQNKKAEVFSGKQDIGELPDCYY